MVKKAPPMDTHLTAGFHFLTARRIATLDARPHRPQPQCRCRQRLRQQAHGMATATPTCPFLQSPCGLGPSHIFVSTKFNFTNGNSLNVLILDHSFAAAAAIFQLSEFWKAMPLFLYSLSFSFCLCLCLSVPLYLLHCIMAGEHFVAVIWLDNSKSGE